MYLHANIFPFVWTMSKKKCHFIGKNPMPCSAWIIWKNIIWICTRHNGRSYGKQTSNITSCLYHLGTQTADPSDICCGIFSKMKIKWFARKWTNYAGSAKHSKHPTRVSEISQLKFSFLPCGVIKKRVSRDPSLFSENYAIQQNPDEMLTVLYSWLIFILHTVF